MKPIILTEEDKAKLTAEFAAHLDKTRLADGTFTFTRAFTYEKTEEKAHLYYSTKAFAKMMLLVQSFSTEVAWHSLVSRTGDREFYVLDVIAYPQIVTGVTVDTDQEEYSKFLTSLSMEDAELMHMQAHSHVNMGVTPSGTDKTNWAEITGSMKRKGFYIFQIWNKAMEHHTVIYDFDNNVMYENSDVTVDVLDEDGNPLSAFQTEAKKLVTTRATQGKQTSMYQTGKALYESKQGNKKKGKKADAQDVDFDDDDDIPPCYGYSGYNGYGSYGSYGSYGGYWAGSKR